MNLTNYEKETIIIFNEAEKTAEVFTYNGKLLRSLSTLVTNRSDDAQLIKTNADGGKTYRIPKSWVKIKAPRVLSDEQREAMRERGRKAYKSNLSQTTR